MNTGGINHNPNLFVSSILDQKLTLPMEQLGGEIEPILQNEIAGIVEGRCGKDGYVRKNSVKLLSYSCGLVKKERIEFNVSYSCDVFLPCAGMILENCVVTANLESAGIEAKSMLNPNVFVVFVYRDHDIDDEQNWSHKTGDRIKIRVVDYDFEIYDEHMTIIGEIIV